MAQVNKERIIETKIALTPLLRVLPFRIWSFVDPQAYVLPSQHSKNFFSPECDQAKFGGKVQSTKLDKFLALFLQNGKTL